MTSFRRKRQTAVQNSLQFKKIVRKRKEKSEGRKNRGQEENQKQALWRIPWIDAMPIPDSVHYLLYMLHHLGDKFTNRDPRDSLCYPELQWVIDWWLSWVCFHMYSMKTFLTGALKSLTRYFTCCFNGWCHFPIFDNCWDTTKKVVYAVIQPWAKTESSYYLIWLSIQASVGFSLLSLLGFEAWHYHCQLSLWTPGLETQMSPLLDMLRFLPDVAPAGQQGHAAPGVMITLTVLRPAGPTPCASARIHGSHAMESTEAPQEEHTPWGHHGHPSNHGVNQDALG